MSFEQQIGVQAQPGTSSEDHWIPLADIMTGLMLMFLLIAIVFMMQVQAEKAKIDGIATSYSNTRDMLYLDLDAEFRTDLPKWHARLDKETLSIRFEEPKMMFDEGSDELKTEFQRILSDFFPRYVRILDKYRSSIDEIRIEGHTSSVWRAGTPEDIAYIENMRLSQNRTLSALQYVLALEELANDRAWVKKLLTANGLSSSKLVLNAGTGEEDEAASRRVEFRVRTKADESLGEILREISR